MFEAYEHNEQRLTPETEALIANGLDFLNKAREELEAEQVKFSIVSFWTAVEILLKVPLVHEHWTLACTGKKVERRKYLDGDFQSVSYDDACARLGDVLEMPLSKNTMTIFDKVRKHRNRVVHFYHNELGDGDQLQILAEQADAWFELNRLMRDEWASLFGSHKRYRLGLNETRMLRSSEFYAAARFRYQPVQAELAKVRQTDVTISRCGICQQDSQVHAAPVTGRRFIRFYCIVCHAAEPIAEVCCPSCNDIVQMKAFGGDFECGNCSLTLGRYEALLLPSKVCSGNNRPQSAGCVECEEWDSVCEYGDKFLCSSCLEVFDRLETCELCHHRSTEVSENSIEDGCVFCGGRF